MDALQAPVFLFSLPRSGSTLTQRLLATREESATASEPWILLTYLYALCNRGVYADSEHSLAVEAIKDFCRLMPEGEEGYLSELREFVHWLYAKGSDGSTRYFLDKTPVQLGHGGDAPFPGRKAHLSVVQSLGHSGELVGSSVGNRSGEWNIYYHELQLFEGLESLVEVNRRHRAMAHVVRYEDSVADPHGELGMVFDYLNLPYDPGSLDRLKTVSLEGNFKDQFGISTPLFFHARASTEPLEKWKRTLVNPIRKAWCRRYLRWIGAERLALMGYDFNELLAELDFLPTSPRWLGSDALNIGYGLARNLYRAWIFKDEDYVFPGWVRDRARRGVLPNWLRAYITRGTPSKALRSR